MNKPFTPLVANFESNDNIFALGKVISEKIIEGVKYVLDNNLNTLMVYKCNKINKSGIIQSAIRLEIYRGKLIKILETQIQTLEDAQEFELCAEIIKLISYMKENNLDTPIEITSKKEKHLIKGAQRL